VPGTYFCSWLDLTSTTCYTTGSKDGITVMENVKTAISIRRSLFEQAEELARRMKISRSGLFALALEDYIRRQKNQELLASLNAAYSDEPSPAELAVLRESRESYARRLEDEW